MKFRIWVITAMAALVALGLVINMLQSPEEKLKTQDQEAIDGCRQESKGADLTLTQQQAVISACQKLEDVYRYNWGADPRPPAKDI